MHLAHGLQLFELSKSYVHFVLYVIQQKIDNVGIGERQSSKVMVFRLQPM